MELNTDHNGIDPIDITLMQTIADTLEKHYPGWGWLVQVESINGMVYIQNMVMAERLCRRYGMRLFIQDLVYRHEAAVKKAIQAGGELLERAGLPRSRYTDQQVDKIDGVPNKVFYPKKDGASGPIIQIVSH